MSGESRINLMLASIHQPNVFPRTKTMAKILSSKTFFVLEHTQYAKQEWQNRLYLRRYDDPKTLVRFTFPVKKVQSIRDINNVYFFDFDRFYEKFQRVVHACYRSSPHLGVLKKIIRDAYVKPEVSVADFGTRCYVTLFEHLSADVMLFGARPHKNLRKSELVLRLCADAEAIGYVCGSGGSKYLDRQLFARHGMDLFVHECEFPISGLGFNSTSVLDYIGIFGLEECASFLRKQNENIRRL